jgi:hypothetical protein
MQILRNAHDLSKYLKTNDCRIGCLADTSFLYGLAYDDDRLFTIANDVHDLLATAKVPIYANVISRMELIDLVFRKQVTAGCVELFNASKASAHSKEIHKLLKDIRDKVTAASRRKESYKIDESRLKRLRSNIDSEFGVNDWLEFCSKYVGSMLTNEWKMLEQEFGLNYVEVLEGQSSPLFKSPLYWDDMVEVMATYGQRGPDAMIVNLFAKSHFTLLITGDGDLEYCLSKTPVMGSKAIFIL